MGTISVEKSNHLIWLGRYTERAFTLIRTLYHCVDDMIDKDEFAYRRYLDCLGLPYIYGSREVFIRKYISDLGDLNSVASQINRALDNAIVLREELTSETLCFIQMAQDHLKQIDNAAPLLVLQRVMDDMYAFWGSADDNMVDEEGRNLMKCGKYVERLDLMTRFDYPYSEVRPEVRKFVNRLSRNSVCIDRMMVDRVAELCKDEETYMRSKNEILSALCMVLA